jgi:hypothetical protein
VIPHPVHSVITSRDGGEANTRCEAPFTPRRRAAQRRSLIRGEEPRLATVAGPIHLFGVDIDEIIFIDTTMPVAISSWLAGRRTEFVRRGTSATTLGYPEPVTTSDHGNLTPSPRCNRPIRRHDHADPFPQRK